MTLVFLFTFAIGQMWGATETIFSASPNSSITAAVTQGSASIESPVALTSSQATLSGGTMYMVNTETTTRTYIATSEGPTGDKRKCFKIEANKQFFKVVLTSALAEGDEISADLYKNNVTLWLSTATSRPSSAPTAKVEVSSTATSSTWTKSKTYTVAKNDGICGETTFYIYRNSNSTCFNNFIITRTTSGGDTPPACTTPPIAWETAPASAFSNADDMTASVSIPSGQTVTWTSSNTSVATVSSTGVIDYKAVGTTTIKAEYTYSGSDYCEEKVSISKEITVSAPMTYHAISGTQEMYGLYTQIFNKTSSVASAYSTWVSSTGSMSGSGSSYTAPEGWLSGSNNEPGYGYFSMTNAQTVKFYVTNCTKVEFLQKAGGSSRSMTLSVKKNDVEVSSVKQENNLNGALVYSGLTATDNYVVTITGSDGNTNRAYQMRFTAGELPDATKYTVGVEDNNPCVAGSESATITLSGSQSGVSYQLYKDNAVVDGKVVAGTGSAISFTGIEVAGTYTVKSVASATYKETAMNGSAVVTLAESPVITTQPTASQKVAVNAAISLSVATSTEGVSYQWFKMTDPAGPAVEIDGAKSATLNVNAASTATTIYYYCVISKSGMCSVESDLAEVITKTGCETEELATSTITGATTDNHSGCSTTIKLQDANGKLNSGAYFEMSLNGGFKAGDVVTVNVKANDMESGKLYMVYGTHESYSGYQVQDGPTNGNTDDIEFIIPSDMATIGFLRKTNTGDEEKEQNHEIKSVKVERETCYCVKPTIGTQPASSAICSGLTATLTVGGITGGAAPYTYAWYNGDGTAVSGGSGATTASYTTAALAANASYYCVVSTADGCSAQSSTAAITIKPATTITTQPVDAEASVGIAQTFSVEATGAGTLEYQWQIKNGENWDDIANADEATYSVSKDAAGAYQFRCIVSGDCGDDVISNVVTLTVSADIFTVTYNANGGTCATPSATWSEGDEALVLPAATKTNWDFIGWYDAATGGNKIASPYTPSASIELFAHYVPKLVQAIYSNSFDAFIKNQAVTVYYMEGESAPTLTSIKVLGVENPTYVDNGSNIVLTVDEVAYTFPVTKTAVAPYTYVNGDPITFDGTETYIKSGYNFSTTAGKEGWRFSKNDTDWSRETPGNNRIYFFIGAAESITLTSGCSSARAMKVYRNGTQIFDGTMPKNSSSPNYVTLTGSNAPAMYAVVSNQTDGDGAIKIMALAPWVPVTGITLKEGTTAITSKEIAEGAQFTLTAEVTPANASNPNIVWESENADIASVADGVVTGEASGGPVNIIARSQDDNTIYATCAVTVAAPCTPSTIEWNVEPTDGVKGGNGSASVTTNYAAGLEVTSSDPTVASVSNDGVNITINYLKKGTTKITATVVGDGSNYCNTPVSVEKTITVEPDCPAVGNLFSLEFLSPTGDDKTYTVNKNSDPVQIQPAAATIANGEAYFHTGASSDVNIVVEDGECAFRSSNSNNYIKIEFECPLQVGDIISFTSSVNRQLNFYKDNTSGTAVTTVSKKITIVSNEHALYGATVLCIKGGNQDCKVQTISIDRPAQITLNGNGGNIGDETSVVVPAIGATQLPNARKAGDFYFVGWSLDQEGNNMVVNPYTPTATTVTLYAQYDDCVTSGTVYKFEVATRASGVYIFENGTSFPASAAMTTDNYLSTLVGGDLTASVTSSSGNYQNIYIDNSGVAGVTAFVTQSSYGVLTMDLGCPLKAGDVIRYNIVSDSGKKLTLKDDNSHSVNIFGNNANEVDEINVPADFVGATQLTLNYNGSACRIASFEVYRRPAVTGVSLADATVAVDAVVTPVMTILPSAEAYVSAQEWSILDDPNKEVASINATTGAVTGIAAGTVTVQVKLNNNNALVATCQVEVIAEYSQVSIDNSIVWNFANALINNTTNAALVSTEELLLANVENVVNNPVTFNSQALVVKGIRVDKGGYTQAATIKFITDVPGFVNVEFSNTGNAPRPDRYLLVNGERTTYKSGNQTHVNAKGIYVPAGEVVISSEIYQNEEYTASTLNIFKVEFIKGQNMRTLTPGRMGTFTTAYNVKMFHGADFFVPNQTYSLGIEFISVDELKAGYPYFFVANDNALLVVNEGDAATEAAADHSADGTRGMVGYLGTDPVRVDVPNGDDYAVVKNNHLYTAYNNTMTAGYAYFDMTIIRTLESLEANNTSGAPRRRMTVGYEAPAVVTDIDNLSESEQPVKVMIDGQLFIIRGEKMFDATGRLVK